MNSLVKFSFKLFKKIYRASPAISSSKEMTFDQLSMDLERRLKGSSSFDKYFNSNNEIQPQTSEDQMSRINPIGNSRENQEASTDDPQSNSSLTRHEEGFLPVDSEDKKEGLIHPKDIPYLKLEKIYNYDTIQLLQTLKYIEFKKENLIKLVNFLAVVRKKRDLKFYDFPEITSLISYVRLNLTSLPSSYAVSFVFSLSKMQNFDLKRPTLDNENLVYEVLNHLTDKMNSLDIRGVSNLVYSLHTFQLTNPQIYNFSEFFTRLEEVIIQKISKHIKTLTSQDLTNIILAYCKTQNGSQEFYHIIQEVVLKMESKLTPQDLAIILYSYSNNPNCLEKVLEDLEDKVKQNIHKFKPKEICSVVRAYHNRSMLNEDLKKLFAETLIEKHELTNSTDLAHSYVLLCQSHAKFVKYANQCISNLYFSFTSSDLGVIFTKAEFIQKSDAQVYDLLKKQVSRLIKKKEFTGFDLKKVYEGARELPFEGKYNIFVEQIEKHLQDLKYY